MTTEVKPNETGSGTGQAIDEEQRFFSGEPVRPEDQGSDAEVDPELLSLPRGRRRRHPLISLLVIALSLYLMYFIRADFFFFLQPRSPRSLGDAATALKAGKLKPNTFVELSGAPDRKHALILESRFGGYENFFRLLETTNKVFIQQHREMRHTDEMMSASHIGQLVRFDALPHHRGLAEYFSKAMDLPHDLDFKELARAKAKSSNQLLDRDGIPIELNSDSRLWINAAFSNEWIIQFRKTAYPNLEDTEKHLVDLNLPLVIDEEASTMFWRYVTQVGPDELSKLLERARQSDLGFNVVQRQLSYSARWSQLSIKGNELLINAADPTFPKRYALSRSSSSQKTQLAPMTEEVVHLPSESVLFITASSPFSIDPDALVLIAGKSPSDNWPYLLIYLVMITFILINSFIILQRLQRKAKPS
jgi:hypothetical protein